MYDGVEGRQTPPGAWRAAVVSSVVALALLSAPAAHAAAPAAPTLAAPAAAATGVSTTASLQAGVSDPDGGNVEVVFHGRPVGAAAAAGDFTFAVIPDTQNYGN